MLWFNSAVAARSAGEDGVEALLSTEENIVAPTSAAIAALVRIHVLVFIRASKRSTEQLGRFSTEHGHRLTLRFGAGDC